MRVYFDLSGLDFAQQIGAAREGRKEHAMTFDAFLKNVGRKIAGIRRDRALTQKAVAAQAGISYRYFQNIETGAANMTLSTLYRLARFFNVHVHEFVPGFDGKECDEGAKKSQI